MSRFKRAGRLALIMLSAGGYSRIAQEFVHLDALGVTWLTIVSFVVAQAIVGVAWPRPLNEGAAA